MPAESRQAPIVLPALHWNPTLARGDRHGHPVELVVMHRWASRYIDTRHTSQSYQGVIRYFQDRANGASAHFVFPGSAVPNHCTQMVAYRDYAWTQAALNPACVEVESADAVWLGHDPHGLAVLARITAFLLRRFGLPPVWSSRRGFCRHADLGAQGGGHTQCPTTSVDAWKRFVRMVQHEHQRGDFLATWGR